MYYVFYLHTSTKNKKTIEHDKYIIANQVYLLYYIYLLLYEQTNINIITNQSIHLSKFLLLFCLLLGNSQLISSIIKIQIEKMISDFVEYVSYGFGIFSWFILFSSLYTLSNLAIYPVLCFLCYLFHPSFLSPFLIIVLIHYILIFSVFFS